MSHRETCRHLKLHHHFDLDPSSLSRWRKNAPYMHEKFGEELEAYQNELHELTGGERTSVAYKKWRLLGAILNEYKAFIEHGVGTGKPYKDKETGAEKQALTPKEVGILNTIAKFLVSIEPTVKIEGKFERKIHYTYEQVIALIQQRLPDGLPARSALYSEIRSEVPKDSGLVREPRTLSLQLDAMGSSEGDRPPSGGAAASADYSTEGAEDGVFYGGRGGAIPPDGDEAEPDGDSHNRP